MRFFSKIFGFSGQPESSLDVDEASVATSATESIETDTDSDITIVDRIDKTDDEADDTVEDGRCDNSDGKDCEGDENYDENDDNIYSRPLKRALTAAERNEPTEPQCRENRRRNKSESALYNMPTDILCRIFDKTDFLSQQMIRHTYSRFSGVVSYDLDPETEKQRTAEPFDATFGDRQVWPSHGTLDEREAICRDWAGHVRCDRRIRKERGVKGEKGDEKELCGDCRWFEASGQLGSRLLDLAAPKFCIPCGEEHRRGMFSAQDRKRTRFTAKCIGRRGRVRLCAHADLSWNEYQGKMYRVRRHGMTGISLPHVACPEGCHWRGCTNSFPLTAEDFKNSQLDLDDKNRKMLSRTCVDQARNDQRDKFSGRGMLLTWANRVFEFGPETEASTSTLTSTSTPTKAKPFYDFVKTVDTASEGPYLCPHMEINDGQLLRAIQWPYCICFPDHNDVDDDKDDPPFKIQPHSHGPTCPWRCHCRYAEDKMVEVNGANDNNGDRLRDPTYRAHTHGARCPVCGAIVLWRRQGRSMHLEFVNRIEIERVSDKEWIRKLDPHSWGITEDEESKHVYWCPDKKCKTNHQWKAMYKQMGVWN